MKRVLEFAALFLASVALAFDPGTLSEVGLGLGGNAYWSHPVFANALWNGSGWLEFAPGQWGTQVHFEGNPQFNANGLPQYLNPGRKLRALVYALHANPDPRPASWPDRTRLARGKVVVTWKGDADIRAEGGVYVEEESSGPPTGSLVDGRRVYRYGGQSHLGWLTVESVNPNRPLTDLKVWLPDPADPMNTTLENRLFHPTFLARLGDVSWAFLRFMDWNDTNGSPQKDWADRRPPRHVFMGGVLNRRPPAPGFGGDRGTGIAFEHMVALCNATGCDLWINVPHLATDDFVTRLAQLIRYGSDGLQPCTNPAVKPLYPPLARERRVFVEYSNEIWSSGNSFAQGNWAQEQARALGISKEQFNARRFCQVWRIFQDVFGGETGRVVRVAAVWTGMVEPYTRKFLSEIATYGPTLKPPQTADVVAPTTYFGNGIQDWAYAKARQQAGSADPWFFTADLYTNRGAVKPVSVAAGDSYWESPAVLRHVQETFTEWKRRLLGASTQSGGGPDATGIGGGFDYWLREAITNAFGALKPLVSYEGGPSIYTDYLDSGDPRDAGITTFLELMNRQPQFRDVYRIHLNLAKAKGLRTHGAFVDVSAWGRYGQWGHLEYLDQPPGEAVKWDFLMHWPGEMAGLRHVDEPRGAVPAFVTPAKLPPSVCGKPYTQDVLATDGDGTVAVEVVDQLLTPGLSVSPSAKGLRLSGTPTAPGENYLMARARDGDGDPAWRTFFFRTVGGTGVVLECDFDGAEPARHLPWTNAFVVETGVKWSGWEAGGGILAAAGADALVWSQNQPAEETNSTLARAVGNNQYWRGVLTLAEPLDLRHAEVRFTVRRLGYHAPRRYAVFTGVAGFVPGAEVFDTGHFTDLTDREFVFRLPDSAAYAQVAGGLELRLVGWAGQYSGHLTSLRAFRLARKPDPR